MLSVMISRGFPVRLGTPRKKGLGRSCLVPWSRPCRTGPVIMLAAGLAARWRLAGRSWFRWIDLWYIVPKVLAVGLDH